MTIREIGGEFAMLDRLTRRDLSAPDLVTGIGDDCAVLSVPSGRRLLITTDMMVENDHFSRSWQTPSQIGMKLIEANVSDIVCKGGTPRFAFLSMCLTEDVSFEFMEEFYRGLDGAAARHGVLLAGGDTTHGALLVFNLTLTGVVEPKLFRPRSGAKKGDLICVTGSLGGSTAGLELLRNNKQGYLRDYLAPKTRTVSEGRAIARYAHAMIDVSDGLGSEVTHIARESGTGAVIYYDKIPLSETTIAAARELGRNPADFALYGGEDFQIVFTIAEQDVTRLMGTFPDFTVVGEIVPEAEGITILRDGQKTPVGKGFDHFG